MPTFYHTWDSAHGHHRKVVYSAEEMRRGKWDRPEQDGWTYPNNMYEDGTITFTVRPEIYSWIDTLEPSQRKDYFEKYESDLRNFVNFKVIAVPFQHEECLMWKHEDALNIYLKSQLSTIQILKLEHRGDK